MIQVHAKAPSWLLIAMATAAALGRNARSMVLPVANPPGQSSLALATRRAVLSTGAALGSAVVVPFTNHERFVAVADDRIPFQAFQVESSSQSPKLNTIDNMSFLDKIASIRKGTVWLGEHHNSDADHNLQVQLVQQIVERRRRLDEGGSLTAKATAIGLEQVQVKFQPVLDDFVAGKISASEMRAGVEWDTRWIWPFEGYLPVFEAARDLQVPLIALNVNSEDTTMVEKGGLPGLPRERLQQYIRDAPGFAAFTMEPQFRAYVDYVIQPSYQLHRDMGLLQSTMSGEKLEQLMPFRNFLSGRILWDEGMASNAYEWTRTNEGGLLIGIVGADHVKFRNGIPGRYSRMASDSGGFDCVSVMLNPTLIDTLPSGASQSTDAAMSSQRPESLALQLRYLKDNVADAARFLPESTGGVLPLADYLVIGR